MESGVAVVEEVMSEKITPPAPTLDSSKNVDVNSQENVVKGSMKDYFAPDLSDNTVKQTEQKVSQEYKMDDLYDTPTLESQKKVDISDNVTSNANAAGVKIDGFNWLEEYFAQEKSLASDADTLKNMLSEEAISGGNPYLKTVDEIIQKMIDAQTSGLDLNATQEVQALIDATKKLKTGEVILNRAGVLDGETPVIVSNKMANKYGEIVKQVQVGLDSGTFTKTDAQKMLELLKEKGVKSTESITELKTKLEESVYETTIEEIMSGKITPPESTGTLKGSLLEKIKSKFGKPNTDTTTSDFISQPFSKGGSAISGGYSLSDLYSEPSMDGTSTSTDIASNIGKDYVSITPNVGEQGILKFCRDKYKTKIVEELGKYYGDAGYDIHKMFESGKTVTQILSELNGKKKLDFENFLQNTISGRYLSTLSEQEILALRKYCGNGAQLVNGMLRTKKINGDIDGIDAHKFIEYMDSAIERYGGLECTTQLFRGISVRSFIKPFMKKYGALFSFDMSNLDEVYASIKTLEGKEFGDLGYMSTSPGYDTSFANSSHYPVVLDITAPTGTKGAYINQISGFYNSENELLLARNTTLRITEILPPAVDTNGNNKIVVKCEVVPVSESGSGKVTLSETVGRLKGSLVEKIKSKFGKPSPDAASDFISKPFNEGGSVTGDQYSFSDLYSEPSIDGPSTSTDIASNADFAPLTLDSSKNVDVNSQENVVKSGMEDYFAPDLSDNIVKQTEQKVSQEYNMDDLYDTPTLEPQKKVDVSDNVSNNQVVDSNNNIASNTNADFAPPTLDGSKSVDVNPQENVVKSGMEDYFTPNLSDNTVKQAEQKVGQDYKMEDLYDTPTLESQKEVVQPQADTNTDVVEETFTDTKEFDKTLSETNTDTTASENLISADSVASLNGPSVNEMVYDMLQPSKLSGYDEWGILIELSEKIDNKTMLYKNFESEYMKFDHMVKDINNALNEVMETGTSYVTIRNDMLSKMNTTFEVIDQKLYEIENMSFEGVTDESLLELLHDAKTDLMKRYDKFGTALKEIETEVYNGKHFDESKLSKEAKASLTENSIDVQADETITPPSPTLDSSKNVDVNLQENVVKGSMKDYFAPDLSDNTIKQTEQKVSQEYKMDDLYDTPTLEPQKKVDVSDNVANNQVVDYNNNIGSNTNADFAPPTLDSSKNVDVNSQENVVKGSMKDYFAPDLSDNTVKQTEQKVSQEYKMDDLYDTPTLESQKKVDISDNVTSNANAAGVKIDGFNWLEEYFAQEKSLASDADTLKNMLSEEAISGGSPYLKTVDEIIQKMIDAQESGLDLNTTQEVQALIDATKKLKPGEVILNRAGVLDGETPVVISNKIASKYGEIVTQVQVGLDSGTFTKTDAQKMLELLKEKGVKTTESITELKTKLEESAFETIMKEIESGEIAPPTPTGKLKGSLVEKIKSKFGKPNTDATTSDFISQPFSEVGSVASMGYSLNDLYSEPSMDGTSTSTDIASNIGKDYVSITPNVGEQGILKFCRDKYKTKIVEELGKYYGDAGYDIHKMFESGKTVTQILSELNGKKKLDFENFLQNTISGRYLSTLSEQEILALRKYTDGSSVFVNSMLRAKKINGEIDGIDAHKFIEYMDSAIERYGGLECTTQLFRGISVHSFIKPFMKKYGALFNFDMSNLDEVYASIKTLEGKEFGDLGYMSTSPGYDTSFAKLSHYPVVLDITAPTGTKGAYINQISGFYNLENELLLARDTTLRITEILPPAVDTNGNDKIVVKCVII